MQQLRVNLRKRQQAVEKIVDWDKEDAELRPTVNANDFSFESESYSRLSEEQKEIHDNVIRWILDPHKTDTRTAITGYAGTGKTTVVNAIADSLSSYLFAAKEKIAFSAYTGKASLVLSTKVKASGLNSSVYECGTIHSLFLTTYRLPKAVPLNEKDVSEDEDEDLLISNLKDLDIVNASYKVIFIDEASMIGESMYSKFNGVKTPIIFVGDPGQLPPVNDKRISILDNTPHHLKTIHRQAEDNPIIKIANVVRSGGHVRDYQCSISGKALVKSATDPTMIKTRQHFEQSAASKDFMLLCYTNNNRIAMNKRIRSILQKEYKDNIPNVGEKIVCLANNKEARIMNGQIFYVGYTTSINNELYLVKLIPEAVFNECEPVETQKGFCVLASKETFNTKATSSILNKYFEKFTDGTDKGRERRSEYAVIREQVQEAFNVRILNRSIPTYFDFGYCLSVHKSQGSEWSKVFINSDCCCAGEKELLYTAITRARDTVVVAF